MLFLDELPEFQRPVLEVLRQPMEEGRIHISRAKISCHYPADFMLIGAMNPCPCGYFPDRSRCSCSERQVARYWNKISGPLLDRIDMMVRVDTVPVIKMKEKEPGEPSAAIRMRVEKTRRIQRQRYKDETFESNSRLTEKALEQYCGLNGYCREYMFRLLDRYGLSFRGYVRMIKLARTIADMEESEAIRPEHMEEAALYRMGWNDEY